MGGLRRFADYIKMQSWFTTSCKEKAFSSHVSSFWDQRLGAVIYSTLSETPLPGGQGDSVHANADNSLLSGIWNVDHSSGSVALTQGERGEIGIPQVPRTPLLASH